MAQLSDRLSTIARGFAVALCIAIAPAPAVAGPFDVFGFGSRAIGLANAVTATADDYTAVFYNPANLVLRKKIHLGAEVFTSLPNLSIALNDPTRSPAPIEAGSFTSIGLGVLFPLGGKIDYRFAFSLVLVLPVGRLLRVDSLDPVIPRWYLWDSLADKLQILVGVGGEITPWLSLGVGVQSLSDIRGDANVNLDLINEEVVTRDINVALVNSIVPIAGLHLGPFRGLSFGFSWRSALKLEFDVPVRVDLGDALGFELTTRGQALYTPHTLNFGLSWAIPDTTWLVTSDLHYLLWSLAPDPALYLAVDVGGDLVEGIGAEDAIDLLPGPSGLPGFSNVLTFHLGAEVWLNEHFGLRTGYQYRPSPIPDQVGLTNYVDRAAHTVSAGIGLSYPDPLNLDDEWFTAEVTGAFSILPETETVKLSEADPVGSYTAGGGILTLSFSLRHDF